MLPLAARQNDRKTFFFKNSSLVTTGLNMQNISKMQCDELNCQLITTRHMTLFRPLNRPS